MTLPEELRSYVPDIRTGCGDVDIADTVARAADELEQVSAAQSAEPASKPEDFAAYMNALLTCGNSTVSKAAHVVLDWHQGVEPTDSAPAMRCYVISPPQGFIDYVKRNYCGEVVFADPEWHALRLWNAAMKNATPENSGLDTSSKAEAGEASAPVLATMDDVAELIGVANFLRDQPNAKAKAYSELVARILQKLLAAPVPAQPAPARDDVSAKNLSVWYGAMPESNGKSNFTAILHAGDITEGITLDRSEYPDRVRYTADCARYLIGEIKKRPFILDYDGDKCSDYAKARALQSQPAAQVTDEMVRAYLDANDAYWKEQDAFPIRNPSKWRNGTPQEATAVSLRAALSCAQLAAQVTDQAKDADMFWDSEDGENFGDSIQEIIENTGLEIDEEMTLDRAKRMPSIRVRVIEDPNDAERPTYEVFDAAISASKEGS